jgi:hypothetical protein
MMRFQFLVFSVIAFAVYSILEWRADRLLLSGISPDSYDEMVNGAIKTYGLKIAIPLFLQFTVLVFAWLFLLAALVFWAYHSGLMRKGTRPKL